MKVYNGGSDQDNLLSILTGNILPSTTLANENQVFISYTSNGNGGGKGFSASFAFGKKVANLKEKFNH